MKAKLKPLDFEKVEQIGLEQGHTHDGNVYSFVCERPSEWATIPGIDSGVTLVGCSFCARYASHLKQARPAVRGSKWSRCEVAVTQPSCIRNHALSPQHAKATEFYFSDVLGIQVAVLAGKLEHAEVGFPGKVPQPEDYMRTLVSTVVGESNYTHAKHAELDWVGQELSGVRTKHEKKRWVLAEVERSDSRDFIEAAEEMSIMADEKNTADAVAYAATNRQLVTKVGILGILENLKIETAIVGNELENEQKTYQKYCLGLEKCIQNFSYEGKCALASFKTPGTFRPPVDANVKKCLSTICVDGAPSVQKASRTFAGRNTLLLAIRDLCHLLNKHGENVSASEPMAEELRHHLFTKKYGFLKETMYSSRLGEKIAAAQVVILKANDGVLRRVLLSYSHSSVRFSGECDALINHCLTFLACTLANSDEADDDRRSAQKRAISFDTLTKVHMCIPMAIYSGLYTDLVSMWQICVQWSDRTVRDISKTDWLLQCKFKESVEAVFVKGCVFADWESCKRGLYTHVVMLQLSLKRKFWVGNKMLMHHDPEDPTMSKAAQIALKALRVAIAGLFALIDEGCDLKFLENAFRAFHLERWRLILEYLKRKSKATVDQTQWATDTNKHFETCYGLICKARGWPNCWMAFQRVIDFCVEEWVLVRPKDYDELASHGPVAAESDSPINETKTSSSDELNLQSWRLGFAKATANTPQLECERPKLMWYLNLCHTGTSGNERILKQVNAIWKSRSSFLSRQSLEDSVVLKCGSKAVSDWVDFMNVDAKKLPSKLPVRTINAKPKMKPRDRLRRADAFWRQTFEERYVLARKCSKQQVCKSNKQQVSKRKLKALQIATVKKIVARHLETKKKSLLANQPTVFGLPMKRFMVNDIQECLKECPAVQEVVESFKRRYDYKSKEQADRNLGKNPYLEESKRSEADQANTINKSDDVEAERQKANDISTENSFFVLRSDHEYYVQPPSVADHWRQVKLVSNAHVIVVKDLSFAAMPKTHNIDDDLAVAMLCGKRVATPEYVANGGNKDHLDTSIKFIGAIKRTRGVRLGDNFRSKHRYLTCVLEKVCAGSNVGWQLLTTDGEEDAFTKAKKPVSTLDNLSSFVDLLKHDAQYDRKRSAKGKYQRK